MENAGHFLFIDFIVTEYRWTGGFGTDLAPGPAQTTFRCITGRIRERPVVVLRDRDVMKLIEPYIQSIRARGDALRSVSSVAEKSPDVRLYAARERVKVVAALQR